MFFCLVYAEEGVKHMVRGPDVAHPGIQFGPLDDSQSENIEKHHPVCSPPVCPLGALSREADGKALFLLTDYTRSYLTCVQTSGKGKREYWTQSFRF